MFLDGPDRAAFNAVIRDLGLHCVEARRLQLPSTWTSEGQLGVPTLYGVIRGQCTIQLPGDPFPIRLHAGDAVVLPRGDPHRLLSGGGLESLCILHATFAFADTFGHPVLAALPPTIMLRGNVGPQASALSTVLALIDAEFTVESVGAALIIEHLVDVILLDSLRARALFLDEGQSWLHGATDDVIAPALGWIHSDPGGRWTIAELATRAHRARAPFSRRFCKTVGVPPRAFLDRVRIHRAKKLLLTSQLSLTEVARALGFGSQRAFRRAFLRATGTTPAAYRRRGA